MSANMVSLTTLIIILSAVAVIMFLILFLLLKRFFRMKAFSIFVIGLIMIPISLGGITFGLFEPGIVKVIDTEGATHSYLFADSTYYDLANANMLKVKPPANGTFIVNNSPDSLVIEKQVYSNIGTDENSDVLFLIPPYSGRAFPKLKIRYLMEIPDEEVEAEEGELEIIAFWLRKYNSLSDPEQYQIYHGETLKGERHGIGVTYNFVTGEEWDGNWFHDELVNENEL